MVAAYFYKRHSLQAPPVPVVKPIPSGAAQSCPETLSFIILLGTGPLLIVLVVSALGSSGQQVKPTSTSPAHHGLLQLPELMGEVTRVCGMGLLFITTAALAAACG